MMRPCGKCAENSWKYEMPGADMVRAICRSCGGTVEFPTKRARKQAGKPPKVYAETRSGPFIGSRCGERPMRDASIMPWDD